MYIYIYIFVTVHCRLMMINVDMYFQQKVHCAGDFPKDTMAMNFHDRGDREVKQSVILRWHCRSPS